MLDFFAKLFRSDFMPHAHCYLGRSDIIWLNVISDSVIALAYYSIPISLMYFVSRRRDMPFPLLFLMFGAFIIACGSTHLMEVWSVWHGTYRLTGLIKAITAVLSLATAVMLVKFLPDGLAFRTPTELATANQDLQREIAEHQRSANAMNLHAGALANMAQGVHLVDAEGILRYANPSCESMFGYERGELIGKHMSTLNDSSPEENAHLLNNIRHQLEVKGEWSGEVKNRKRDGSPFITHTRITSFEVSGNKYWAGVQEDVTELNQAQQAIRAAHDQLESRVRERTEELALVNARLQAKIDEHEHTQEALYRLAAIVESSGDAIIGVTLEGIVTSWNSGAERIFGYKASEMKAHSVQRLALPDQAAQARPFFTRIREGGPVQRFEIICVRSDGTQIDVSQTLSPIFDGDGHVIGASIISRDITQRKQAEAQIAASLQEKEVLLKEIHHRVKNNLQIISSLLSLQSRFIQDKQALEIFQESRDRVRSMALIHEKLYQSKDLARIDFNQYIRNLAPMMFRSYSARGNAVRLETDVDPIFLNIDMAVPLSFILNELVSNSLKHAFPEGATGVISIGFRREADGQLNLVVRDNGTGMPKDFNLENASSLGLHLVKLLTEQLGGRLTFQSNGGTEFRIVFTESQPREKIQT